MRAAEGTGAAFYAALDTAWPPGFFDALAALKAGNGDGLEIIIDFLEADPQFFRTGYTAEKSLRWINRMTLTRQQQDRLRVVLIDAVERRHRQYFRRFCALARVLDSPVLRAELEARLDHDVEAVRKHARWMYDAVVKR